MTEDIETSVGDVPGVDAVSVETVADKIWTQERMTEAASAEREEYFRERVSEHGLSPAYDGEEWVADVGADAADQSRPDRESPPAARPRARRDEQDL